MPAIYHEGSWLGNATDPEVLVKDTVGWTGKNLLKNEGSTVTHLGVTFTVNPDGSITANGTSTGVSNYVLVTDLSKYQGLGDLYLTGCPEDGGESKYEIIVCNSDGVSFYHSDTDRTKVRDFGNGTSLNVDAIQSGNSTPVNLKRSSIRILTRKNQTVNNLVFKPMIRHADITDPTYEPYHESVEVMYEEEIHGVNLLKNEAVSKTENGITFTVNANGSVTVNGTASSTAYLYLLGTDAVIPNIFGGCKLTGCPSEGSGTTYGLVAQGFASTVTSNPTSTDQDNGSGTIVSPSTVSPYIRFYIRVQGGTTVNNLVFKPMLRKADIEDSIYRPYNNQAIQNQLNAQGVLGAKNWLPNIVTNQTKNGITWTKNSDGTLTANGTATAASEVACVSPSTYDTAGLLQSGQKYIYSIGIPLNMLSTYGIEVYGDFRNNTDTGWEDGLPIDTPFDGKPNKVGFYIRVKNGVTVNNLVFKPMVRLASDPDDTYVPYAMTNRELTEKAVGEKHTTTITTGTTGNWASTHTISTIRRMEAYAKGYIVIPFVNASGTWFLKVLSTEMQPVASQSIEVTYWTFAV